MQLDNFINCYLQCPQCLSPIEKEGDNIVCTTESKTIGRIEGGIIDLLPDDRPYHEFDSNRFEKMLEKAQTEGCYRALSCLQPGDQINESYFYDPTRSDFIFLLPVNRNSVVLDAGCGFGSLAVELSKKSELVIGVDMSIERLNFTRIRLREEGISNVVLVHTDITQRWFRTDSISITIINGLLEWIPLSGAGRPDIIQRDFLSMVREWLKPGGKIYVGIENRFARSVIRGKPDPHSGLFGTSIVPRALADLMIKTASRLQYKGLGERMMGQKTGYRTWTYSLDGYLRMFKKAGYKKTKAYAALPHYNNPHVIIPAESNEAALWYLRDWWMNHLLRKRLINKEGLIANILARSWILSSEAFLFIGETE